MKQDEQIVAVTVLYFGRLKELAGCAEEQRDVVRGSTIEELFERCCEKRGAELKQLRGSVVASRNREFTAWSTIVESGDEVGFLPPVSGG